MKDLTQHYLRSFAKKKLTWTREDFLREQYKKKEKNVLLETQKYLKEIKEIQNKVNKGQAITKCISIFNEYLVHHNQMMNKRNRIQSGKKPVKKIINKNLIEQQNKKEEERKKKAEEERINYLELFDKMRDYLEKEEDDDNAYNDYLELMEIAKERKLRGDYDYNNMVENKNDKIKPKLTAYNKFLNNIARMETYVDSDGKIAVKKNVPVTGFGKKLAKSILLMKKKK